MTSSKFNITPRMLHLQSFNWFKQFAEGAILMDTALDSIEFTLGSNFDHDEWMDLAYCVVMEPDCWRDIERAFMQKLGIGGSSSELNAPLPDVSPLSGDQESASDIRTSLSLPPAPVPSGETSGDQESAFRVRTSPTPASPPSAGPLLKDPSAWRLMMDWAQDKFGYGELDDKMRAYGPRYVHEEWKELINEVFMQSDPGAENAIPAPLVVERAMELQGIRLTADSAPAPPLGPSTSDASTSSQGATRRRRLSSSGATQKKRRKLNASIFLDIDAEDEGDDIDEGDDVDDCQVGPSGKGSFLRNIDILCKRFDHGTQESVAVRSPIDPQIPAGIFPPPLKNIYIVDFYSASARTFAIEYMKSRELEATTLLWLPLQLYVEASCPLEVQQNLPPSHRRCHKDIVLLPPQEGTSIMVFKARQILPTPNWVRIKKSAYKGDLGYVAESTEGKAVVLVAPRQLPYDSLEESGERTRFDVELARVADLDLVPILASSGVEIGYSCDGHQFVHGLLRLPLPVDTLEFHAAAGIDPPFVEQTLNLFSAQFWRERDIVEVREGDLRGKRGALVNVDWHKRSAVVLCDDDAFECNLRELRRAFSAGDTAEVIAGPFCGERGYVVALHEHTIVLVIMQPDKTSETVEVSRFVVQSHLQEHILSLGPADNALQSAFPLSGDEALPGDVVRAHRGPFAGQGGIIEWISPDGKVWVSKSGKGKNKEDALTGERDPASSQIMVAMDVSDLHVERAPNTLTFSKDRGYNVAVGDTVEVARGQWRHSEGIVKTVDLTKASLDIVRPADGIQINVPITFVCKIKERFDHGLSQFVGQMSSWVGIFGQPIQLKNKHIATLTGMLLDGTLLPPQLQRSLKSLHSRSFITPVVLRNVTPPPSPGPLDAGPSDVCSVTPADITETQTLDYGEVPWLFKSDFCDFKSFHFGFNVSVGFTQVSLGKRVVRTVCPDRFVGQNGPASPGSVCVTVTGHNAGSAMQHLTIPARYLTPANPTGKNQLCLILKGPQAGRVVSIKKCQRNSKSVVTDDGTTFQFSDICVAFEYNRA
ncbi:hypothetical protein EDC04DRAFT_3008955 [Pisolithus marmoratus]|nr:hypothetical protein EDC04DRAFT_3008955 [Pisolithus marmoratus]